MALQIMPEMLRIGEIEKPNARATRLLQAIEIKWNSSVQNVDPGSSNL